MTIFSMVIEDIVPSGDTDSTCKAELIVRATDRELETADVMMLVLGMWRSR